jgi:hypothetical protein
MSYCINSDEELIESATKELRPVTEEYLKEKLADILEQIKTLFE